MAHSEEKYIKKVIIRDKNSSPEARAKRLKFIRNMAKLKQNQLCDEKSLNYYTYKAWERGRHGGLPKDGAARIIKRIAREGVVCEMEWLLHGAGAAPQLIFSSSKKEVVLPKHIHPYLDNEEALIVKELALFKKQFPETTHCQITDDGLSPFYNRGDYVAGIKYYDADIATLFGQTCIVETAKGEILVRNLKEGNRVGTYALVCINMQTQAKKAFVTDVLLASAAPILRVYRKILTA